MQRRELERRVAVRVRADRPSRPRRAARRRLCALPSRAAVTSTGLPSGPTVSGSMPRASIARTSSSRSLTTASAKSSTLSAGARSSPAASTAAAQRRRRCASSATASSATTASGSEASASWGIRNRRKKLSDVARATVSTGTSRSRAISSATCTTSAGWLRLPRCGTGARYGLSVSISMRSSGTRRATSCSATAFLNVTMPENEMWKPRSSAARATSQVSVKQCMTPPDFAGALLAHDRERVVRRAARVDRRAACRTRARRGCACGSARAATSRSPSSR